jgi:hypothetical protein
MLTSGISRGSISGNIEGRRCASWTCPPGPHHQQMMTPAAATSSARLPSLLSLDVAESGGTPSSGASAGGAEAPVCPSHD